MHLEHYEPQASWRNSIWMFVAGTAVGAVAALMMAPTSGRESREYIRKQGRRVADDAAAQADKLASAVRWGQEHASTAVRDTVDSAKAAFSGTMDSAKAAFNAAKSFRDGEATQASASTSTSQGVNSPRPTPARPMTSSPSS